MTSPTTLSELRTDLEQSMQNGVLVLTAAASPVPALAGLLDRLPNGELRLPAPDLQLTATELTVAAATDEQWPTGMTGVRSLHLTWILLRFTQPAAFAVAAEVTGSVRVGDTDVSITGTARDDLLTVELAAGTRPTVALVALADFVSDNKLSGYLPPDVPIFDSVPLSALRMTIGYGSAQSIDVTAGSTLADGTWPLVDGLADLENIGVTLGTTGEQQGERYVERISGDIHATLHLGQDFRVRLAMLGQYAWALEIQPADGNVLPGLAALAGLAGDAGLADQVERGLAGLGIEALAIDGVSIAFDLAARALQQVVITGHVTLDGTRFDVALALPNLTFHGGISPTTPIHLSTLVGRYLPGGDQFPDVEVDELDITAIPDAQRYSLAAAITSTWVLDVGPVPVGFERFSFEIDKDHDDVTGYVEGAFSLFGAEFEVLAEHAEATGGWQFTGQSVPGAPLTFGAVHDQLVTAFGVDSHLPASLADLALNDLRIWFDSATQAFDLTCAVTFPIDDKAVDLTVTIRLEQEGAAYRKTFGGTVVVGDLEFDLRFAQGTASTVFVAVYTHTGDARSLQVRDLVAAASTSLAELVPEDLEIDLRDVLLVVSRGDSPGFLLGLDLGLELGLSQLPLVGKEFPPQRKVGIDSLRLLAATRDFAVAEIGPVNALLPASVPGLPDVAGDTTQGQSAPASTAVALTAGLTVTARLFLGDAAAQTLSLPAGTTGDTTGSAPATVSGPAASASDNARWFDVQRSFGPVYFQRVGFEYQDRAVRFLLDAALSVAGLTLSLDGLAFGSSIDHFAPTFDLRGVGVDYRDGPVEIGGALLRSTVTPAGGTAYDEYDGAALIRTEAMSIAALGSYAYLDGAPSLFVYAVLDRAIGGPPFFFVTGLAAGFGYNRAIVVPTVDKVADFPLITAAKSPQPVTGTASPKDLLGTTLATMRAAVPPSAGSVFLAVGVKFLSFRIIDSFALLVASFGRRFELNLLGLSTVVAPTPEVGREISPLAEIQLAVKASFVPDDGFLGVSAQLTAASFLFSRDCHLTGGFAFYSWFAGEHDGDFALTVGGYHPSFTAPPHYPKVPALGFNWQVDPQLVVKGNAYYALTPVSLMAGGHLEAVWSSDDVRAAFVVGADFIVAWKPYHYDASAYVDVNASYRFLGCQISVDVGASLHIWGPEFAGTAHITLLVFSFDVTFGPQGNPGPTPVDWPTFSASFLPDADRCAVAVTDGLIRRNTGARTDLGVLDPQRLALATHTVIPSTGAHIRGDLPVGTLYYTVEDDEVTYAPFVAATPTGVPAQTPTGQHRPAGAVAVGPMAIALPEHTGPHLTSTVRITITKDGTLPVEHHFAFVPVLAHLPAGMWGELGTSLRPDPNAPALARDVLVGFEIRPNGIPDEGTDRAASGGLELLQYHLPRLAGGTYRLDLVQDVTTDEAGGTKRIPAQRFTATGDFVVSGARASLTAGDIYAVYPPDGALGDYRTDLPHIILDSSTLPWQETADPAQETVAGLALLLFDEPDLPVPHVVTVGQLRDPATLPAELRGVGFPADTLDKSQPDDEKVTIIDLPSTALLPPQTSGGRGDLALLAHVRRDADGTERAVVVGNRLPRPGARHVAHLVSVRGRYTAAGFTGTGPVRLVSLTSWRFTAIDSDHDLTRLFGRVRTNSAPIGGARPTRHTTEDGAVSTVGYHGPLVPVPTSDRPALPARAATELAVGNDASLAAAWTLGRLLALRDKPFAAGLFRWKRARARRHKSGDTARLAVPEELLSWLDDLALLHDVPFNYLVPAEDMLPVESLRFFSLHRGWVACLLDGALSIGRGTPGDFELDRGLVTDLLAADALAPWTRYALGAEDSVARSGFLIRSDTVAGWPDLAVTAVDRHGAESRNVRGSLLSANVLLQIFDGEIANLSIRQADRTRHCRVSDPRWQTDPRVVDVTRLAADTIGATTTASASLAARLLADIAQLDIGRPLPAGR
ncbi:DUF6603 domain-containing protein [Actinophytocola oryzae]|uniref:DUF6603 domain-containing protein n=1 Tax=Actinophytocola oryzae TaxID=502181 RepID=A0A4R7W2Y2_9PSEU|nr:DUF6603 domain-containing protein [Actinophytocola oryzae]TDV55947.1 hypothetical protein CLV71_1028 [Actinophytocola oryzae]